MTVSMYDLIDRLADEESIVFVENKKERRFSALKQQARLLNKLISMANANYKYVLGQSMPEISNSKFELIPFMFVFDSLCTLGRSGEIDLDSIDR